jgi:hypothetical protein
MMTSENKTRRWATGRAGVLGKDNSNYKLFYIKDRGKFADVLFDNPMRDYERQILFQAIQPYINRKLIGYQAGWGRITVVRKVARKDVYPLAARLGQAAMQLLKLRVAAEGLG